MISLEYGADFTNHKTNYSIKLEIASFPIGTLQKLTPPTLEIQELRMGRSGNGSDAKRPGKVSVGDLVIERFKFTGLTDNFGYASFMAARERLEGYLFNPFFTLYDPTGFAVEVWECGSTWVKSINTNEFDVTEAGAGVLMETITFAVDRWQKVT